MATDVFDDDNLSPFASRVSTNGNLRPSLAFDPQARPHIGTIASSSSGEPGPVEVFTINPPTLFGSSMPDPAVLSSFVSLAINPLTGYPAVAYNDVEGNGLKYAEWDGDQWNTEAVDTQGAATSADNMPVSLAFDPADGLPAIAYTRDSAVTIIGQPAPIDVLRFAWHDGTSWNTQTVDSTPLVAAGGVSLAFNEAFSDGFGDGLPAIAYIASDDTVRYVHDPPLLELPGDYNANGLVEQGDLDLVLLHWGEDGSTPPRDWIRYKPDGSVDQQELDAVLLNWGNVVEQFASSATAVPEPTSLALGLFAVVAIATSRRSRLKSNRPF